MECLLVCLIFFVCLKFKSFCLFFFSIGAGVGVLRILRIDNSLKSNIVPADFVVNLILVSSTSSCENFVDIFNFSSCDENCVT